MKRSSKTTTAGAMSLQKLQSKQQQKQQQQRRKDDIAAIWRPTNLRMRHREAAGVAGAAGAGAAARSSSAKGPPTPTPSWKLYENPFYEIGQQAQQHAAVSARKLAASLWELQQMPVASSRSSCSSSGSSSARSSSARSSATRKKCLLNSKSSDTSSNGKKTMSRQLVAVQTHVNRLLDKHKVTTKEVLEEVDIGKRQREKQQQQQVLSPPSSYNDQTILERLNSLEEQSTSSAGLAGKLRLELEAARLKVKELENANRLARRELDNLLRKIADEKAVSYSKEQDRVKQALQSIRDETEEERKSRRKMELAQRKLAREVGEAKMALSKALQDRDKERKARALMEDVCDELAREIGQDKAEIEELRRESNRIREDVEEERRMLQIAEVWREERVHMKLLEARLGIEEKVALLDRLRVKLQDFLKSRRRVMDNGDYASQQADIREAETLEAAVQSLILQERKLVDLPQPNGLLLLDEDADDPQTTSTRVMTSPVKLLIC